MDWAAARAAAGTASAIRSRASVAVRAKPTVPHTAPRPRFPSAMRPWTPQYDGLQRDKVTHHGTEKKRPASRDIPASGPSSQVVAGVGFEPT